MPLRFTYGASSFAARVLGRPALVRSAVVVMCGVLIGFSTNGLRHFAGLLTALCAVGLLVLIVLAKLSGAGRSGPAITGRLVFERLALCVSAASVAALVAVASDTFLTGLWHWLWLPLWLLALAAETFIESFARKAVPTTANFEGVKECGQPRVPAALTTVLSQSALALGALSVFTVWASYASLLLSVGALLVAAGCIATYRRNARYYRKVARSVTKRLVSLSPRFVLHWQAPKNTQYQIAMWLPYLEELNEPFFVLVRTAENLAEARKLTQHPVVLIKDLEDLDSVMVPTLKVALYTNNSTRNVHLIRYMGLTHIQLNHGDSDKAPSYNPAFRMFDRNFVAGQAAIDRYTSRGIETQEHFFEIVSRPQTALVESVVHHSSPAVPTVLYAPTWHGFNAQTNYTSLTYGEEIVRAAVEYGATIVFRPHPYSLRSSKYSAIINRIEQYLSQTGGNHVYGQPARSAPLTDLFNQSDALITDISSVLSDYIASEKPFIVASMLGPKDLETEAPLSKVGYTAFVSQSETISASINESLQQAFGGDPLRESRVAAKAYYLGDFDDQARGQRFGQVLRSYL